MPEHTFNFKHQTLQKSSVPNFVRRLVDIEPLLVETVEQRTGQRGTTMRAEYLDPEG
jgi:hypothetical protein